MASSPFMTSMHLLTLLASRLTLCDTATCSGHVRSYRCQLKIIANHSKTFYINFIFISSGFNIYSVVTYWKCVLHCVELQKNQFLGYSIKKKQNNNNRNQCVIKSNQLLFTGTMINLGRFKCHLYILLIFLVVSLRRSLVITVMQPLARVISHPNKIN